MPRTRPPHPQERLLSIFLQVKTSGACLLGARVKVPLCPSEAQPAAASPCLSFPTPSPDFFLPLSSQFCLAQPLPSAPVREEKQNSAAKKEVGRLGAQAGQAPLLAGPVGHRGMPLLEGYPYKHAT